jgi:hypothetical protein
LISAQKILFANNKKVRGGKESFFLSNFRLFILGGRAEKGGKKERKTEGQKDRRTERQKDRKTYK